MGNEETSDLVLEPQIASTLTTKLHNPTPIHAKANQIFSFPTTLTSVVIHFPQEPDDFIPDVETNSHIYSENNETISNLCMV